LKSSVFSRERKVAGESASGEEVKSMDGQEDEQTGGDLWGVRSKELVQHRLRSGCRISARRILEAEIARGMRRSV